MIQHLLVCSFSLVVLFLGFFGNVWHVAEPQWFANHQRDMEAHIVGRIVESRQDGVFSHGGLPGLGSPEPVTDDYLVSFQYTAYVNGLTFRSYSRYQSQVGAQGILFSFLDLLIPLSPQDKLRVFSAFTSLLTAASLAAVVLWFHLEFGWFVAFCVISSAVISQWLVVFGRNLWWSMWAFYVPLVVMMFYLRRNSPLTSRQFIKFAFTVFLAVFIKCLFNGYEYITTTLLMMMVPFVYYGIRDRMNVGTWLKGSLVATAGSCAAILLSMSILCLQIASVSGRPLDGVTHVLYSLQKRTHGNVEDFPSEYSGSLKAATGTVVTNYVKGTFFDLNNYLYTSNRFVFRLLYQIRYLYLICVFGVASLLVYAVGARHGSHVGKRKAVALLCATWVSILAPLSWFIIFKAHSHIHVHMNYVVWQMPFTLFGCAVCGMAVARCVSWLRKRATYVARRTPNSEAGA